MKARIATLAIWAAMVLPWSPAGVQASTIDTRHLQSFGQVDYIEWTPAGLQRPFHIFVDLPDGYGESNESYPLVLLLDGGNTFPLLSAYHHYLRLGNEAPPLLLVGISYGSDSFRGGNYRQTDFTAPTPDRDFWGGAGIFGSVIEDELIPMIEQRYRADPRRRILFGHSLGGQFVLHAALTRPHLFHGLIASNPAIVGNLDFFIDRDNLTTENAKDTRLFVCMAQWEREELKSGTLAWRDAWLSPGPSPWSVEFRVLPGQTHLSSVAECFGQSLKWVLPAPVETAVDGNASAPRDHSSR